MFKLTFDASQDIKRFLAIGGVSLALVISASGIADAAKVSKKDGDRDRLVFKVEVKYTDTSPTDADTDDDRIQDGDEDADDDGIDNSDEPSPPAMANDDLDDDDLEDGDDDDEVEED